MRRHRTAAAGLRHSCLAALCCLAGLSATPARAAAEGPAWFSAIGHPSRPLIGALPILSCPAVSATFPPRNREAAFQESLYLPSGGARVEHAAASADATLVALGTADGTVYVLRAATGEVVAKEGFLSATYDSGVGKPIQASPVLEFSPDGRWLLAVPVPVESKDESAPKPAAFLLDLASRKRYELHSSVTDWGFSPKGDALAFRVCESDFYDSFRGSYLLSLPELRLRLMYLPADHGLNVEGGATDWDSKGGIRALGKSRVIFRLTDQDGDGHERGQVFIAFDGETGALLRAEAFDLAAFLPRRSVLEAAKAALARLKPAPQAQPFSKGGRLEESSSDQAAREGRVPALDQGKAALPGSPAIAATGSWTLVAIRKVGGKTVTVLGRGIGSNYDNGTGRPSDCDGFVRIRVEDEGGKTVADRVLDLGSLGSSSYGYLTVINDDGSISFIDSSWNEESVVVELSADLSKALAWKFPGEDYGGGFVPTAYDGSFMASHTEYQLNTGGFVAYSRQTHSARLFTARESEIYPSNMMPVAVTPHFIVLWAEGFREGDGESELSGFEIFRLDGSYVTGIVMDEGEDEENSLEGRCAWEKPDGSLILTTAYRSVMRGSRELFLPAIRVVELGPSLQLSSRLLPFPWESASALPPDSRPRLLLDREGAALIAKNRHDSGDDYFHLGRTTLVSFSLDAEGLPDPMGGGIKAAWSFDNPLFPFTSWDSWWVLPRKGGYDLVAGFVAQDRNGSGILRLPGESVEYRMPGLASPLRERRPPELVDRPWVDFTSVSQPVTCVEVAFEDEKSEEELYGRERAEIPPLVFESLPLSHEGSGNDGEVALLNDSDVRIRTEAGTSGAILGKLDRGEMVLILERGSRKDTIGGVTAAWYRIRTAAGIEGWVFSAFLDERKAP